MDRQTFKNAIVTAKTELKDAVSYKVGLTRERVEYKLKTRGNVPENERLAWFRSIDSRRSDSEELEEDDTTGYTVIAYWEEYNDGSSRRRRSRFTEDYYDTADEAISASVRAQVDDADTVRIFRGLNVEDEIGDWKDISDRIKAGCEVRDKEERARRTREIAEETERLRVTQEKYERLQLQKLLEKYGPEGVDVP